MKYISFFFENYQGIQQKIYIILSKDNINTRLLTSQEPYLNTVITKDWEDITESDKFDMVKLKQIFQTVSNGFLGGFGKKGADAAWDSISNILS
jgi:hypothetical protein